MLSTGSRSARFCVFFLILLLQVPFGNQAFHIDDNIFLTTAANLKEHPFFPQDWSGYFEGLRVESFASHEHPLWLSSWILGIALSQDILPTEVAAHCLFQAFLILLLLSAYSLAGPLTRYREAAVLLCAFSPAVFLASHTVMLDLPYAALLYGALALQLRTSQGGRQPWAGAMGGLLCAAAVMLAYQAALFIPVVAWANRQSWKQRVWIVLLPALSLLGYAAANSAYFGRFIWADLIEFWRQQPPSAGGFPSRMLHSFWTWVGALAFPAGWLLLAGLRGPFFREFFSSRSGKALAAMVLVNLALLVAGYHVGAVRYWIPSVPSLSIFLVALAERSLQRRWRPVALTALVASTAGLSLLLAHADRQWAGFYRQASEIVKPHLEAGVGVWIAGEWGFRWYFSQAGAQLIGRADTRPEPGDVLIRPKLATPYLTAFDADPKALQLHRTVDYIPSTPVRLLDSASRAGFYSFGWGVLPYSIATTSEPLEQIFVYRIQKKLPPPAREPTYWDWNR